MLFLMQFRLFPNLRIFYLILFFCFLFSFLTVQLKFLSIEDFYLKVTYSLLRYKCENEWSKSELFHLRSSIEILSRILNNEKPYPNLDREVVF